MLSDDQAKNLGQAAVDLLNLKYNSRTNRVKTAWGEKSLEGLGHTLDTLVKDQRHPSEELLNLGHRWLEKNAPNQDHSNPLVLWEAIGQILAFAFDWHSEPILRIAAAALEDGNYHNAAAKLRTMAGDPAPKHPIQDHIVVNGH